MKTKPKNIFSILDDSGDSDKANVDTLIAIVEEFGQLPSTLYCNDDIKQGWDYIKVSKIAYYLARQQDKDANEVDIKSKITHHNIYQIVQYISKALAIEIPEDLQELILSNIEMSKLDVMRRKLNPEHVKEIVSMIIEKGWLVEKDFDNTIDEPKEPPKN